MKKLSRLCQTGPLMAFNMAVLVFALASQSATADILLFDDFANANLAVGDGTSVNGGFELVGNTGNGTGTVGESGSNANIATAADSFNNAGIVSSNSFSTVGLTSFSTTWVVDSQTGALGTAAGVANFNSTELLLQGGTGFRAPNYIEFVIDSTGAWSLVGNDGTAVTLSPNTSLGVFAGVQDGYSVTLGVNAAGWEVSGTGFDVNPAATGAWAGTFDYSDLQQATLHTAAMIQTRNNNLSISLDVDSISVSTVAVPEPSSFAMLGLSVLGLCGFRRRR